MYWQFFILVFAVSGFTQTIYASEELAPIDVTATKELSDFHLGGAEILSTKTNSTILINESIESVNGVVGSQNGGPGSRTSYFIRGTEARHVSFTIDNLKINDPSNTDRQYDAAFLTSPFLREITLYKGPQAVLFGSDAMGGLIDMKTRKGEQAPETRLAFNAGSFGTLDASLSQDWQNEENRGTFTWTSFRTDGISRLNDKRFNATERDGADITQITSSSAHNWANRWQTDFLVSFLRGNNELDGATDDNSHDRSKGDQYLLQQRTNFEISSDSSVSLRNGLSRHQRKLKTQIVGENSFEGELIQNEFLYSFEKRDLKILTGISNEKEQLEQIGAEMGAHLNSVFAQTAVKEGPFVFQSGLRGETHSRYGNYYTGSAGIGININRHELNLQYSQGFKTPSLYQLYAEPLFGTAIGNENLVPERNNAIEARWGIELSNFKGELNYFRNSLSKLITFTNQGYMNQNRFIAEGVEAAVGFNSKAYSVRPSVTLQEFKETDDPVLRRPTRSLGLDASWFLRESAELYIKLRAFNSRKDLDELGNVVKLNGFETATIGSKFQMGKNEFGLQILNLTNRVYEELYGYNVMPRSFFAHFGHKF